MEKETKREFIIGDTYKKEPIYAELIEKEKYIDDIKTKILDAADMLHQFKWDNEQYFAEGDNELWQDIIEKLFSAKSKIADLCALIAVQYKKSKEKEI